MPCPPELMLSTVNPPRKWLLLPVLALLGGCGAGVITGGILGSSSSGSSSPPPVAPLEPVISLPTNEGPLFLLPRPEQAVILGAVLSNIEVPQNVELSVELRALGATSVQVQPVLDQQLGGDLTVSFFMRTKEISAQAELLFGLTSQDVEAELAVLFDGELVAPPAPFLLLRQPVASLFTDPGLPQELQLSASGGTRIKLLITSLPNGINSSLRVDIATPEPNGLLVNGLPTAIITPCTDIELSLDPAGLGTIVECTAPPSRFPTIAAIRADDSLAGVSTAILTVFYVPDISAAVPRRGSALGGDLVNLTGDGLVPLDLSIPGQPQLDFSRLEMVVRRGRQETVLPLSSLRPQLSSLNNIVFVTPPSPDGRPGPAEVLLRVIITDVINVETIARGIFTYGVGQPEFGPLGRGLQTLPVDVVAENLRPLSPGQKFPLDLALLGSSSGVPEVALQQTQGNGVFLPIGQPVPAGQANVLRQKNPAGIASGDFNQDGRNDLFILNQGDGVSAEHSILLGDSFGGRPTILLPGIQAGPAGARSVCSGDVDEDGIEDLIILQAAGVVPEIEILLTQPWTGSPSFSPVDPGFAPGDSFETLDLIDLDGDGHLDLVAANGGAQPLVVTAYGLGNGNFTDLQRLDLLTPGFTPDADSRVVGVHGAFPGSPRSIAVMFSGAGDFSTSPPTMMLLPPIGPRMHGQADSTGGAVLSFPAAGAQISTSLAADVDNDQVNELIFGFARAVLRPIRMLHWQAGTLVDIPGNVDLRDEVITGTSELRFGLAVMASLPSQGEVPAVFVIHESWVDATIDPWVTTLLAAPGPSLRSPLRRRDFSESLRSLAVIGPGDQGDDEPGDVAAGFSDTIQFLNSDGLGGFTGGLTLAVPNLLEGTLIPLAISLPMPTSDSLAFLTSDGSFGVVFSGTQTVLLSSDLRQALPSGLRTLPVSERSTIIAKDVNRDGALDIVVLLIPGQPGLIGDDEAAILLLLGEATISLEKLPVQIPDLSLPQQFVHGEAASMVLADFVQDRTNSPLELAVAIPRGDSGDQIRFYRYSEEDVMIPGDDRFLASFAEASLQSLPGGFGPRVLAAGDLDASGSQDLIVAAEDENNLLVFLNSGFAVPGMESEVNIRAFSQAASGSLPPGVPQAIFEADYDGDGISDYLVHVREAGSVPRHNLALFISDGVGRFIASGLVPLTRFGDLIPRIDANGPLGSPREAELSVAVADMNRDGSMDLIIGWGHGLGGGGSHIRMLFGGFR